jgi:hypothetical protein
MSFDGGGIALGISERRIRETRPKVFPERGESVRIPCQVAGKTYVIGRICRDEIGLTGGVQN